VPSLLAGSWLMLRETLLADGPLPRPERELVAAAVSRANDCPYCVTVHELAEAAVAEHRAADQPLGESALGEWALGEWALGEWASRSGHRAAGPPPVAADAVPQAVGVATTFQYLNRMVNVFLPESPLPARLPAAMRGSADRLLQRLLADRADRAHPPGATLALLPARGPEHADPIDEAFERAAAAIEDARRRWVPESVAELMPNLLSRWDGAPPPLADGWPAGALRSLPVADRPAGRLALLTAFTSYRVTDDVVAEFRRCQPTDAALLGVVSWASFEAAREIGGWAR